MQQQQQLQQQQHHQKVQDEDKVPLKTLVNSLQATILALQSTISSLNIRLEGFERREAKSAEKEAELMDIIKMLKLQNVLPLPTQTAHEVGQINQVKPVTKSVHENAEIPH